MNENEKTTTNQTAPSAPAAPPAQAPTAPAAATPSPNAAPVASVPPKKAENEFNVELSPKDKRKKTIAIVAIVFVVLLIFAPFLLRKLDSNYKPKQVKKLVSTKVKVFILSCSSSSQNENNKKDLLIQSKYVDSKISTFKMEIKFSDLSGNNSVTLEKDKLDLEEYNEILKNNSSAINKQEQGNNYTISIDFSKDEDLKTKKVLNKHTKALSPQKKLYENAEMECQEISQADEVIEKYIDVDKG